MEQVHVKNQNAGQILEKAEQEEIVVPEKFRPREYKNRYVKVEAYKLAEDSKVHCADGTQFEANAGDYYVCLDQVHEFVLTPQIFKKLFLLKVED